MGNTLYQTEEVNRVDMVREQFMLELNQIKTTCDLDFSTL